MRTLSGLFKIIEGIALFAMAFYFAKFYIKGHFSKHWYLFWGFTIFLGWYKYQFDHQPVDTRSGAEIWQESMRNYDAVNGH